jgi:hypothetical protein
MATYSPFFIGNETARKLPCTGVSLVDRWKNGKAQPPVLAARGLLFRAVFDVPSAPGRSG